MLQRVLAAIRDGALRRPGKAEKPELLPEGLRLYAIGDIHGRADLLSKMRALIEADLLNARPTNALVIFLGDYIDRGPDSKCVIESLASDPFSVPSVRLLGNHEAMLLGFLEHPEQGEAWWRSGGLETAHSYGIEVAGFRKTKDFAEVAHRLNAAIPPHHMVFLRTLQLSFALGNYFFCHAGVRPGVPLDRQREEDLLWIREEFVDCSKPFGAIIVHGHTPCERPSIRGNAIGLDTGAYITGRLTCLVLGKEGMSFLST
jgi:serine/threonine protein phosphatase 1